MIKGKCINCNKDYEATKPTRRYCSDSCRVMWNRKNGKKDVSEKVAMKVLINQLIEKLDKVSFTSDSFPPTVRYVDPIPREVQVAVYNKEHPDQHTSIREEPLSFAKMEAELTGQEYISPQEVMAGYWEEKRELDEDNYPKWIKRLENDQRLSSKQKHLVKTTYP